MAIQWHDDARRYGLLSRVLHWSVAALILWQFLGMGLRLVLGRTPVVAFFVGSHAPVGLVLAGLVGVRLVWALFNHGRRPPQGSGLIGFAARAGHGALYALMLAVPVLGLLRAWGSKRAFAPWGIEIFPARTEDVAWAVELADLLHGELAWVLVVLIAGHAFMAIFHELRWRDGTLARMAGK